MESEQVIEGQHNVIEMDEGYFLVDKDDPDAKYIASCIPSFNFKNVPAFFDVGGITADPKALRLTTEIFAERYSKMDPPIDKVCGLDARGFIFGPLLAQALQVPFFMMRKEGKLPGPVIQQPYETEYSSEVLTIPCHALKKGDRVVIVDDLIATGGTTIASANLIVQSGGIVVEVAVVTAIEFFKGWVNFRNSLPCLKNTSIFAIVQALNTLKMPEGSTDTYVVKAGSTEHNAMLAAMENAPPGAVIIKNTKLEGQQVITSYTAGPIGPEFNVAYLEEGKNHDEEQKKEEN